MSQSPVPVVSPPLPPAAQTLVCANCGGALAGEYCGSCGQRHEPHVHTVAHFASEAFESVTHADSRLWRTLWYLLARPGYLTREFFAGRRARYLPPFRLYLVISVVFFLVVGEPDTNTPAAPAAPTAESVAAMESAADALENDMGPGGAARRKVAAGLRRQIEKDRATLELGAQADAAADGVAAPPPVDAAPALKEAGLQPQNVMTEFCDEFKEPDANGNQAYANMRGACLKISADGGAALARSVVHNIPRAMFVFLPLLALVMRLLYWRPKRYYVEHLLFLVHNHAFVFLMLAILGLLELIPRVGEHLGMLEFAIWVYMIWYIYRGMRNVYQQGRGLTLLKYFTIGYAYILAGMTVLVLTALYSVMNL